MKKRIGILVATIMILVSAFMLTGCADTEGEQYTKEIQNQIQDSVGYPNITSHFEYSQLKEIYELRDDPNLICYWYTKNEYTGKWVYQGKCIGYGIPYSASITSPEYAMYTDLALPLPEPNGIYTNGLSTSATWILSCDTDGNISPLYVEDAITVSQKKMAATRCEEWSLPEDY